MGLGETVLKKINKKFEANTQVRLKVGNHDLLLITNATGLAVRLFMGKADDKGMIKGDRYERIVKWDKEGRVIKDHWDRKGKASR